jgi:hypothetical protein
MLSAMARGCAAGTGGAGRGAWPVNTTGVASTARAAASSLRNGRRASGSAVASAGYCAASASASLPTMKPTSR